MQQPPLYEMIITSQEVVSLDISVEDICFPNPTLFTIAVRGAGQEIEAIQAILPLTPLTFVEFREPNPERLTESFQYAENKLEHCFKSGHSHAAIGRCG